LYFQQKFFLEVGQLTTCSESWQVNIRPCCELNEWRLKWSENNTILWGAKHVLIPEFRQVRIVRKQYCSVIPHCNVHFSYSHGLISQSDGLISFRYVQFTLSQCLNINSAVQNALARSYFTLSPVHNTLP
jgi:hypothetical protein